MAAPPLRPYQLEQEIKRVCQKEHDPDALVIGVQAPGEWHGDGELLVGDRRFTVVRADMVLAVREVLAMAEADRRPMVLLTALDQSELGHDVVARLVRGKLRRIDLWEGVKRLFRARQLDPSLRETCLARALLESRPPDRDYDPVPAGVLDAGTAWRAILHHAFGLEDREPDMAGLLRWAATTGAIRYREAPDDLRRATQARLAGAPGPAAVTIFNIIEAGAARDAMALAVACEVVFAAEAAGEPTLQAAAARLERFHLNRPIEPDVGRTLAHAAAVAIDDLGRDDPDGGRAQLVRADALLEEIQAAPWAHLGRRTPLAWAARLRRFARDLAGAIGDAEGRGTCAPPGLGAREAALDAVAEHALAAEDGYRGRLERAGMALRLARWLGTPEDAPAGSFAQLARRYRDELAFVDWARDRVLALADDTYVAGLAGAVAGDLGGRVGIVPRIFLKKLVGDVLDRIDQHPDFDPRRHYRLTIAEGELTRVERAARGAPASVDDIELDL